MTKYKIIPNGLWQKEITEDYPKEVKPEITRESIAENFRERNVTMTTNYAGYQMFEQALRDEVGRRANIAEVPLLPEAIRNYPYSVQSSIMQSNNVFPIEQLRERIQELREEPEIDYLEQLDQMSNE